MLQTRAIILYCLVFLVCHHVQSAPPPNKVVESDPVKKDHELPAAGDKGNVHSQNANHPPKTGKDKHKIRIDETEECAEDVKRFCSDKMQSNNFMILDCLQNNEKTHEKVSDKCHHFLWNYKLQLTKDIRFDHASEEACKTELSKNVNILKECDSLPRGEGKVIPCLIEHYDELESQSCQTYINKMAGIVFSDYRFMEPFISDCKDDIAQHHCGRVETADGDDDDSPHSQGRVVACLNKKKPLHAKCKKALLKVAEIQSDDYHLDRPLYYACKDDRERLCGDVVSGNGQIFKCLYKNLEDKQLSQECKVKLEDRQKLIDEDVKVDKSFYDACKKDIKENGCAKKKDIQGHSDDDLEEDLHRTDVLLCLERAQNKGKQLDEKCVKEMFDMRSELMQDYKISPELVSACQDEIEHFCDGLDPDGESVHCLMEAAKEKSKDAKKKFSDQCRAEVQKLLHIINPGEDIRLDAPLKRACGDIVASACHDRNQGHGDVITCLLDNLDHDDMTDECEEKLLEIQYFAVRDFQLDHHLFKHCKKDAKELCHGIDFDDPKSNTPNQGPLIFTCLHRHYRSEDPKDKKPTRACQHEIRRVMRERGTRIELIPEIEENCIGDLSQFCSDNDEHKEKGAEMECLQLHLEDLSQKCNAAVSKFTEEEVEDVEMDHILMKHCTPMIKKYCQDLLDNDAQPNDVLDCMIEHKHAKEMDSKCAAGIEHHQIISLKEFRFNHKFREACETSVNKFCQNKKTKYDVVACLSEHVRNDTLMDARQRIDKHCQRQLKAELLERSESIKLDPILERACKRDIPQYCGNLKAGEAQVIECLKNHKRKLSDTCHKLIFKRQQEEAQFGDYKFLHVCKKMIKMHCRMDQSEPELFECLKGRKDDFDFDSTCRKLIVQREVEESRDFRLDPALQKSCRLDIPKHCSHIFKHGIQGDEMEMEGRVINCLKKKIPLRPKVLTKDCENEIKDRIREAAVDINQNPVLMQSCKSDIKEYCQKEIAGIRHMSVDDGGEEVYVTQGEGAIIECLKRSFQRLRNLQCKKEVAYMIAESRVDVHIDPVLNTACQKEIMTLCDNIPQGQGRQMSCLLAHLQSEPSSLGRSCGEMLKRRRDLWELAAQVAPAESFSEIYDEIISSPAKNYFLAVFFCAVGIIFIVGLTCGRVTKRLRAELKNK